MFSSPPSDLIRFFAGLKDPVFVRARPRVCVLILHRLNTRHGSVCSIQDLAKRVGTNLIKFLSAWKIKFRFYKFRLHRKMEIDLPLSGPCRAILCEIGVTSAPLLF